MQGKGAHGGKGAKTFGPAMHAAGRALIGKLVLRYWEDQGGWWGALVGDYLIKSGKHKLIYDAGGEDVSAPYGITLIHSGYYSEPDKYCFMVMLQDVYVTGFQAILGQ